MARPRRFAFVSLRTTGPSPTEDRPFAFEARLPNGSDPSTVWSAFADPGSEALRERARRVAVGPLPSLENQPPAAEVALRLRATLGDRVWIVFDRAAFLDRWRSLEGDPKCAAMPSAVPGEEIRAIGVSDLARLVLPGRRSAERDAILRHAFPRGEEPAEDLTAAQLERCLGGICRAFLSRPERELTIAASLFAHIVRSLRPNDPESAEILESGLDLLDRPSAWRTGDAATFPEGAELVDGALSDAVRDLDEAIDLFETVEPRFTAELADLEALPPLPDTATDPAPVAPADASSLNSIFEEHLPRLFGTKATRRNQAELARLVAEALAGGRIALVDAPTGTGKTIAYLVPALAFALRAGVRVGVSTYTVALQEQIFDRELPRAFELLTMAGVAGGAAGRPRVTLLKGRERYLCGRALRAARPDEADPPEAWLAWTMLALFSLEDRDGDLDRIARRLPLWLERQAPSEAAYRTLLSEVRCRPRCCVTRQDRRRCGAWAARRRAERSHLVVTNHAFTLRDPNFLRNLIADECDHLHSQARGAASIEISFRAVRDTLTLAGAAGPANPSVGSRREPRDLLTRLERLLAVRDLFSSHPIGRSCAAARASATAACAALDALEDALRPFLRSRPDEFQAFATSAEVEPGILGARTHLTQALADLAGRAAEIAGALEESSLPEAPRLATRFQGLSLDVAKATTEFEEWLPVVEGALRFDPSQFHDLTSEGSAGRDLIAHRSILLPNRWLAERVYPSMQSLVLLSASTWLSGSFDLAVSYLGLDVTQAGTQTREPRAVTMHRSPPTFDYSRLLLTVPDDLPEADFAEPAGRQAFDRMLAKFVARAAGSGDGGTLVLLTNLQQCKDIGRVLQAELLPRGIPVFWQGMEGFVKEELPRAFRSAPGSVLMGVDTFWYGVDFPGALLETVVVAKLPFGAPDRYTRAQERSLGRQEHLTSVYLPEALSMFRQGVGRCLRRESDFGCVHVLDRRILGRWKRFLRELPGLDPLVPEESRMRVFVGPTDDCLREAHHHLQALGGAKAPGPSAVASPDGA